MTTSPEAAALNAFVESITTKTTMSQAFAMELLTTTGMRQAIIDAGKAYHQVAATPPESGNTP